MSTSRIDAPHPGRSEARLGGLLVALAAASLRCSSPYAADGSPEPPAVTQGDDGGTDGAAAPEDAAAEPPGLIGYWAFEETSGASVADLSGHGHDGTIVGTPARVAGVQGRGLSFDGTSGQRVEMPSLDGTAFPASGTLSLWLKHSYASAIAELVFSCFCDDLHHIRIQTHPSSAQIKIAYQVGTADAGFAATFFTQPIMRADVWQHVVAVWDSAGNTGATYVDGKLYADGWSSPGWTPSQQQFSFGGKLSGNIDEVRLYDRALSEDEVARIP